MKLVTKDEFFAYVNPRNVYPTPERDCSVWKDLRTGAVVGRSTPGYLAEGHETYALVEAA